MQKKAILFLVVATILLVIAAQCTVPAAPQTIVETVVVTVEVPAAEEESNIGGQINIIGWEGYDHPPAFQALYDEYGIVPNSTYVGNNDEVISKYKAGGPGVYDVGNINSRYFQAMVKQGMLMPLDEEKLPNLKDLFSAFDETGFGIYEGQRYAVPGFFGPAGLCYRADLVPEPDWNFYKDPAYQGKYSVSTNSLASMYVWGMTLDRGQDASKWTLDDLEDIKVRGMEEWEHAATSHSGTGESVDLLVRGDVVLTTDCWEAVPVAAQEQGIDVKMVVPEGPTKVWVDIYFILEGAPNVDTAYAWLNHALSPTAMKIMAENVSTAVGSERAFEIIDPTLGERVSYTTLNEQIKNADYNILPETDPEPPYVSLDDLYQAFDEIMVTAGQ